MGQIKKYFIPVMLVIMVACHSSDETAIDDGRDYYPFTIGNTWIYNVTETIYDTAIQRKKLVYQEKYEIVDKYKNQLEEDTYVIYLSTRTADTNPWTYSETWSSRITDLNEIIVTEGNIAYLEILLPAHSGLTWKGNKYNTIESTRSNGRIDQFVVQNFKQPYDTYNDTFKVVESDDTNFSYKDVRYSVYAKNIGPVYSINSYIEYCDDNSCFGLNIRKHELTKIKTLAAYVVE